MTARLTAHRATARGLPRHLSADQVEALPFFGRTWYVHGVDYWLRRAVAFLLALVALVVAAIIEYALLNVADGIRSTSGRWAWRVVWAALVLASLVRPARALVEAERRRRAGKILRPDLDGAPGGEVGRGADGAGLGAGARAGSAAAGGGHRGRCGPVLRLVRRVRDLHAATRVRH